MGLSVEFKSSKTTRQNRKVLASFLGVCDVVLCIGEQQYCLYFHIIECGHKDETFMRLLCIVVVLLCFYIYLRFLFVFSLTLIVGGLL